jgi:hypothetical protein
VDEKVLAFGRNSQPRIALSCNFLKKAVDAGEFL